VSRAHGRSAAALLVATWFSPGCTSDPSPGAAQRNAESRDGAPGVADDAAIACNGRGAPFALPVTADTAVTGSRNFSVTLTAASPTPLALGDNTWTFRVDDRDSRPVSGLAPTVVAWMPDHSHGSVKAALVRELGAGRYEAQPIFVSMPGLWQIRVNLPVDGGDGSRSVFSFCVAER
jgi:hypothetical protein